MKNKPKESKSSVSKKGAKEKPGKKMSKKDLANLAAGFSVIEKSMKLIDKSHSGKSHK